MISKSEHKKHSELTRASLGRFARNEVAVYGTTCDDVNSFVTLIRKLLTGYDIAYADADHAESDEVTGGSSWHYKQNGIQVTYSLLDNDYQRRMTLSQADLVLVNGNHFEASHQIVICNAEKEQSLRKRKDQLKNVVAIICDDEVPGYMSELIPSFEFVPVMSRNNEFALQDLLIKKFLHPPVLNALVLTGGKSVRMGQDKSRIKYHGKEQSLHLTDILKDLQIPAFISCREEQREFFELNQCRIITDRISGIGPLGGIASAFMHQPDTAWLILACDLPLLDESVINELISNRSTSHIATTFKSPFDRFPEPLIAIWEPKSYPLIMQFIAQGISCPRKVLINSNALVIESSDPDKLTNVNTPDDLEDIIHGIS